MAVIRSAPAIAHGDHRPAWKTLASGRSVDLLRPSPADIDWAGDVGPALARCARFSGAAGESGSLRAWTVLDHLVVGADLLSQHGPAAQVAFLLHDVHEYVIGDITTPVVSALSAAANESFEGKPGYGPGYIVRESVRELKHRWDQAIYAAAGVPLPSGDLKDLLHRHDRQMLVLEAQHFLPAPGLMMDEGLRRLPRLRISGRLRPMSPNAALEAFLKRLDQWAPAARGGAM